MTRFLGALVLLVTLPALNAAAQQTPPSPSTDPETAVEESSTDGGGWSWLVFASGYYQFASGLNGVNGAGETTARTSYAFADNHGFGLAFAGGDITYATDVVGATMSLRWGQGALGLIGLDTTDGNLLLPTLAQGFVTWTPSERFALDIGQFATIYGAEVAEEWQNANFTRGAVYFNLQPFYHTGVRASYNASDLLTLNLLVANGGGQRIDLNEVPGVGAQAGLTLSDEVFAALGYFTNAPAPDDNENWDQFVDFVLTVSSGAFQLIANADFNYFMASETFNVGGSLASGVTLSSLIGLFGRVEYLYGDLGAGTDDESLLTGTASLRVTPHENLVFTLEPRVDYRSDGGFPNSNGTTDDVSFAVTVGATAHFDG